MAGNGKFSCPMCGKKFKTRSALQQHERDAHTARKGGSATSRPRRRTVRPKGSGAVSKVDTILESSGFLKCAFAPVDFTSTGFMGIPDSFNGKVFSVHSDSIISETVPAGKELWILKCPSPGIAYYKSTSIIGKFTPVYFPEVSQLFNDDGALLVSEFRFASGSIEVTNNTPAMYSGGSIVVGELPLKLVRELDSGGGVGLRLEGIPNSMVQHVYVDNAKNGCYALIVNQEEAFDWQEPVRGVQDNGYEIELGEHGAALRNSVKGSGFAMRGWDNGMSSKLICVTSPGREQSIVVRSTACVEYRPEPDTLLAEIAMDSPNSDPSQMQLYHQLAKKLPLAVPRSKNSGFWDFIKGAARKISGVLSMIPGPIGMIAGGVNTLIS